MEVAVVEVAALGVAAVEVATTLPPQRHQETVEISVSPPAAQDQATLHFFEVCSTVHFFTLDSSVHLFPAFCSSADVVCSWRAAPGVDRRQEGVVVDYMMVWTTGWCQQPHFCS